MNGANPSSSKRNILTLDPGGQSFYSRLDPVYMLTAICDAIAYYFIVWGLWLHRCLDGYENEFMLKWSSFASVPDVVPRTDGRQGPLTNGGVGHPSGKLD